MTNNLKLCRDCNGEGKVELRLIGSTEVECVIDCPSCDGTGGITKAEAATQDDCREAFDFALSQENRLV